MEEIKQKIKNIVFLISQDKGTIFSRLTKSGLMSEYVLEEDLQTRKILLNTFSVINDELLNFINEYSNLLKEISKLVHSKINSITKDISNKYNLNYDEVLKKIQSIGDFDYAFDENDEIDKILSENQHILKDIVMLNSIRIDIHQLNGILAFISPIFIKKALEKEQEKQKIILSKDKLEQKLISIIENLKRFILYIENDLHSSANIKSKIFNFKMQELKDKVYKSYFEPIKEKKDVEVIFEVNNIDNVEINSNIDRVLEILDVLINNALEELALKEEEQGKFVKQLKIGLNKNKICVEDNGRGIKDVKSIFKLNYSTKNNDNYRRGIGLYRANKIAKSLNINIQIETELGVKSKFILELNNAT